MASLVPGARAAARAASTAAAAATAASAAAPAGAAAAAMSEKLAALRAKLDRGPALGDFVTETAAIGSPAASAAACGIPASELASPAAGASSSSAPRDPPKPAWLKIATPTGASRENLTRLTTTVKSLNLATVCEEAKCPNLGQCWGGKEGTATATIMLMGDTCTRGCYFCNVKTSRSPPPLDPAEPRRTAEAVVSWGLNYVVLTSVDRDDLPDQGAEHLASTIRHIKAANPSLLVECLTPDFRGEAAPIAHVARSGLDVYAHNLETVERLQGRVRDHRAGWAQSLRTLETAKASVPGLITKTSLMLGVGETADDLRAAIRDIRAAGIDVITFGQYLRPTKRHLPVDRYVPPDEFDAWAAEARAAGFLGVFSGPLVRSSYKAGELFLEQVLAARRREAAAAAGGGATGAGTAAAATVRAAS